jgi:hypothetical protein
MSVRFSLVSAGIFLAQLLVLQDRLRGQDAVIDGTGDHKFSRDSDIVLMSGGAIEIQVPIGWHANEIPIGREMRVWLTRERWHSAAPPTNGVWLNFHWLGREPDQQELGRRISYRAERLARRPIATGSVRDSTIGGFQAVTQEVDGAELRGWFALVAVKTGMLEIATVADPAHYKRHRAAAESVIDGIRVHSPQIRRPKLAANILDAGPAVGLWKALRGRLRFGEDGRVSITFDQDENYSLDSSGSTNFERSVSRLTGQYQAQQDIIYVTWDDGSRINYRWRLYEEQLLLTDHNGRVSQLLRLVD